jgi:hypothetical protein
MLEALGGDPAAMVAVPRCLCGRDAALGQQQLGDALAVAAQVATDVLAHARQVSHRLKPGRRHRHRFELARPAATGPTARVLAIGLDAIARRPRRRARRRNDHLDPRGLRGARQPEAGRPGLVDRAHRPGQAGQPRHHLLGARTESHPVQLAGQRLDRRAVRRAGVDVHPLGDLASFERDAHWAGRTINL